MRDRFLALGSQVASWSADKQDLFLRMSLADLVQRSRWWIPANQGLRPRGEELFWVEWLAAGYFQHGLLAEALQHRRLAACSFAESRNLLRWMRGGIYTVANCVMPDKAQAQAALQTSALSEIERLELLVLASQWTALSAVLALNGIQSFSPSAP